MDTNMATFNKTIFEANVQNRWKFLATMEPDELPGTPALISSPVPVLVLTALYLLFVCLIGPAWMRNREPFQLKNVIRAYNLLMVFAAAYLFQNLYDAVGSFANMVNCQKTFTFNDSSATKIYQMADIILLVRMSEYLDTIFFTLRKKQNQVTFLHVFHHFFVPLYAYWMLRTAPMRFNVYILLINSFIHILMYSYYFLATFQQHQQPDGKPQKLSVVMWIVMTLLRFKKYMTQLQILQFVSLIFYTIYAAVQPKHCNVPWTSLVANFLLAFGFLSMFMHFYVTVYKAGVKRRAKQS